MECTSWTGAEPGPIEENAAPANHARKDFTVGLSLPPVCAFRTARKLPFVVGERGGCSDDDTKILCVGDSCPVRAASVEPVGVLRGVNSVAPGTERALPITPEKRCVEPPGSAIFADLDPLGLQCDSN